MRSLNFLVYESRPADANYVLGKFFQIAVSIVKNAQILVTFCGENCFDCLPNPVEIGCVPLFSIFFSKNYHY